MPERPASKAQHQTGGVRLGELFRPLPPAQATRELRRERRQMLRRALRGRCPLCGTGGLRSGWSSIRPRCAGCNFAFSRERGYLLGAAWVNLTVALLALAAVLVALPVLTAPDIPWGTVWAVSFAAVIVIPVLFQPFAVVLWLWVDLAYFRPLDAGDLAANDPQDGP